MRIALIYHSVSDFGGAERRLTRIYNELGKKYECDLVVRGCASLEEFSNRLEKADCKINNINNVYCFLKNTECISHVIKTRYSVVHYIDVSKFNAIASVLFWLSGIKNIFTVASVHVAKQIQSKRIDALLKMQLLFSSTVDMLYPWAYEKDKKNVFITPGTYTDLDAFFPKEKEKIMVYAAARLEKIKNPMLLVEACKLCRDELRDKNYKVLLLGKGELESSIRNYIIDNELENVVELMGYRKTSEFFPKTECVFSLQEFENYPSQVIAEAVASGCYLIITDVGYSRKCADDNIADFIEADPEEIKNAILRYLNYSASEKDEIRKKAREYAVNNYSIRTSVVYFDEIIHNLIRK